MLVVMPAGKGWEDIRTQPLFLFKKIVILKQSFANYSNLTLHIFAENIVRLLDEHLLTELIKHIEILDTNKF